MSERSILIVAVDGLRASALGAYGNTTFQTPALDELAAEGFLFDTCFAPSAELAANYGALWKSQHPLRSAAHADSAIWLPRALGDRSLRSTLVADDPQIAELGQTAGFDSIVNASDVGSTFSADSNAARADDVAETALAQLFARACEFVDDQHEPRQLVWLHARGLYGRWDAPLDLQRDLLDDADPPPVEVATPPDLDITSADDPDTPFRFATAYAAQVMVLDACWQALAETIGQQTHAREWLVVLIGVRGFPLGEHGRIGGVDPRLYTEQLQVPWLLRFPDGAGRLARTCRLVTQLDLLPTLREWLGTSADEAPHSDDGRSALPLVGAATQPGRHAILFGDRAHDARAIRTPGWTLRFGPEAERELYVRPDDRWEANDVASLCPQIVDELAAAGEDLARQIAAGAPMPEISLADELRNSIG